MLNRNKLLNISESQKILCVPGVYREKSNISPPKVVIEDIGLEMIPNPQNELKLCTREYLPANKRMISKHNQNGSGNAIQSTQALQILDQGSTSTDRVLNGYWKEFSKETSKRLWLPTKTALQGLDSHYLNGFSNNTKQSSWFVKQINMNPKRMNSLPISSLSSQYLPRDTTDLESIRNSPIQYCRKIRFYPDSDFKILAEKCFGATRFLINQAIEGINNKSILKPTSHIELRNSVLESDTILKQPGNEHKKWLLDVPYDTKQLALKQLASNYKTGFTQLKNKTISSFAMKFHSKRNPYQYFFVDHRALKPSTMKIFTRRLKNPFKLRKKQKQWWDTCMNESKQDLIVRREKNRYYLCIPKKKMGWNRGRFNYEHRHNCVALDPGVRTFQTFYSEEGVVGKLGDEACEELIDLGSKEDALKSTLAKSKEYSKKTRYNIRKRCFLLRTKIKNKVIDLHWKSANYLCSTFKHIFLPHFETSKMARKDIPFRARKIGSKSVRNMLTLSHYQFKQRLKYLSQIYGSIVYDCDEHYTTQACGNCGLLNKSIGSSKIHNCCFPIDRDINAARNIYLKHMKIQ